MLEIGSYLARCLYIIGREALNMSPDAMVHTFLHHHHLDNTQKLDILGQQPMSINSEISNTHLRSPYRCVHGRPPLLEVDDRAHLRSYKDDRRDEKRYRYQSEQRSTIIIG